VYETPPLGVVPRVNATYSVAVALPEAPTEQEVTAPDNVAPPPERVKPVTDAEAVPELIACTYPVPAAAVGAVVAHAMPPNVANGPVLVPFAVRAVIAVTWADDVNEPNSPNTNPAMATAAMSVIAMRMTVAMTGEMAFLLSFLAIFILVCSLTSLRNREPS